MVNQDVMHRRAGWNPSQAPSDSCPAETWMGAWPLRAPQRTGPHPPCSWRPRAGGWACGWSLRLQGSVPEPQSPPGLTFLESLLQTMFPASGRPASEEQRVHPQPSEFREISPSLSPPHALEMSPHPGPPLSRSPPGTHSRGGGAG